MDYQNFVGLPLEKVEKILKSQSIPYFVKENGDAQRKFDTVLVVNAVEQQNKLKLVVDKFMLNI